jgi:hypothetical protein
MNDKQSKEEQLDRIRKCLKNNWLVGLDKYCEDVFDPSQLDKSKGKQVLNWLRYNDPELDNKIEALKAINGVGVEGLEEPIVPKSQQNKTEQVNDMVTVFLNQDNFNFESLIKGELVFNGISVSIIDFRASIIPSIELVIRDANSEQSAIFNIGITHEESLEIFEAEIKDMLFDAFLCFSTC